MSEPGEHGEGADYLQAQTVFQREGEGEVLETTPKSYVLRGRGRGRGRG